MTKDVARQIGTIRTTIGELVELITQIALESGSSEEESYKLASMTIESIMRKTATEEDLSLN